MPTEGIFPNVIQTKPPGSFAADDGRGVRHRIGSWKNLLERLPMDRRPALALAAALVALAFGLRFAEMSRTSYTPIGNASSYLALGKHLASSGTYGTGAGAAGGAHGPTAYLPPAYPYLIAAVDEISGQRGASAPAVRAQRIAQVLLGTATAVLVGLVAYELFGVTAALIALAIAAVYPAFIELSTVLVAENLMTMFTLAAVYSALRALRDHGRLGWLVISGICVGLATLTQISAIVLVVPLAVAMRHLPGVGKPRSVAGPAAFVAVTLLTLVPWLIRDQVVMNGFVPVSDEAGITLIGTYNKASAHSKPPYTWHYYADLAQFQALATRAHAMTEPRLSSRLVGLAGDYVSAHPTAPLAVAWHNTLRMLELEGALAWRASAASVGIDAGAARVGVIGFWLLALLALVGAFTPMARRAPAWFWSIPVLLATVVFVNGETPRFREPIDPFLILLAACALARAVDPLITHVKQINEPPHYDVAKRIKPI